MLDKRKIIIMSKLNIYEKGSGKEDIKISAYYRKDYISFHTIATALWVTLGYILIWALIGITLMDSIMKTMSFAKLVTLMLVAIVGYILVLISYVVFANMYYSQKHKSARKGVRKYNHTLIRLMRSYERESKRNEKSSNS